MDCPDLFTYFPKKKKSLISLPVQTAIQPLFNAVVLDFYEMSNQAAEICMFPQTKGFQRRTPKTVKLHYFGECVMAQATKHKFVSYIYYCSNVRQL